VGGLEVISALGAFIVFYLIFLISIGTLAMDIPETTFPLLIGIFE
jgi:hypothetical protein